MSAALSRVTNIDNPFLIGKYDLDVFSVNEGSIIEIPDYKKIGLVKFIRITLIVTVCLTVSLLNTRADN